MKHKTEATTNVSYMTKVIIDKYKNNEKVATYETHNAGTWRLFNTLCLAIAQYNVTSLVPHYIDIRCITNGQQTSESSNERTNISCLRAAAPVTEVTFDLVEPSTETDTIYGGRLPYSTGSCNVYLSFSIYNDNIKSDDGNYMVLQDGSTSEYALAYVDLYQLGLSNNQDGSQGNSSGFSLATDEMIVVTWVITFKNGTIEEEEESPEDNTGNNGGTSDGSGTDDDGNNNNEEGGD